MAAFSRYPDTMMGNKAYGRGRNAPMVDLAHGAQNGLLQDWPGYISNTPYVRRNLIIKVLADLLAEFNSTHTLLYADRQRFLQSLLYISSLVPYSF